MTPAERLTHIRERIAKASAIERERLLAHTRREIDMQFRTARRALIEQGAQLAVDVARFGALASLIPDDRVKVAESGIAGVADVERVAAAGADAILVGEALVTHGDPRASVAEFIAAGSAAQRKKSA